MKIIFAGTPDFAAAALEALIHQGHEIVAVLTQPDRPAGRGMKSLSSAVKLLAQRFQLPVLQPLTLKAPEIQMQLSMLNADVMVVAAYGLILPQAVLELPRFGCLNIHASVLPRWRGAAPIQRAILAGDAETGITIMQMDAGLETGDILLIENMAITPGDTVQTLHDKLSRLGASSIVAALSLLPQGKLMPVKQDEVHACYAAKITRADAGIDWRQSAGQIERVVRAFNPVPGAYTYYRCEMLKVWQVSVAIESGKSGNPGEISAIDRESITVSCGEGLLRITGVQKAGGRKLCVADFLKGNHLQSGDFFTAAAASAAEHG
ncbi:MAG: methionyl-tRNA formyltransferase [Nitrosomonas sp.]|nr:MAG: methionyl-tRNA formyltransferase [Nitrosomonas sp.]